MVRAGQGASVAAAPAPQPTVATAPTAPAPAPQPSEPSEPLPPEIGSSAATGVVFNDAIDGWTARAPAGWKTVSNRTIQNAAKTTKVYVRFWTGLDLDSALERFGKEFENGGRIGGVADDVVPAGKAVVEEIAILGKDATLRVIMIQGSEGVAEVLLETTRDDLPGLRAAADAVARSIKFVAPDRGKISAAGSCYRNFRSLNGTSVERTLGLDGKGHARWGGWVAQHTTYETYSGKHLGDDIDMWHGDPDVGAYGIQGDMLIVHWNDAQISNFKISWNSGRVGMLSLGRDAFTRCD
jgi:hypothetical protein